MATTADFRNGLVIEYNNDLCTIVQFQHVKPGKGPAFVRTKLKSLTTGKVLKTPSTRGLKSMLPE
jgi:elongation factor P